MKKIVAVIVLNSKNRDRGIHPSTSMCKVEHLQLHSVVR